VRVGLIGTGAIANLHARVYKTIGFTIRACTDTNEAIGRAYAAAHGAEFLNGSEAVCSHPEVDYVDICTLPDYRLEPVELAVRHRKHVLVQKPIAIDPATARRMIQIAAQGGIRLGVVSQHRFDESSRFLAAAIAAGRLGSLLQCDAYVKWYRSAEYYARPVKGSWSAEGGGALINQGIHSVDLLRWLAGPVRRVFAQWRLGALHRIESEDMISAVLQYANGATGVIQASTAFYPGYPERLELHGTKGSAIVTGDRLTAWDVKDDHGDPPPLRQTVASGASDPMAISLDSFERQFREFAAAIAGNRQPAISGEDGLEALEIVEAVYRSCRTGAPVDLPS
jgi:predicted dehydrogenase